MAQWEILELSEFKEEPQHPTSPDVQESLSGYLARQGVRGSARAFESLLGLPGDVLMGLQNLVGAGVEKVTGQPSGLNKQIIPLPTSQQVREYVTQPLAEKALPEGYIEPQSSGEQFLDNVIGDFASLLVPVKGKIPFARAFLGSAIGNTAQKVAQEIGASEGKQVGAKAIGMTIPFLMGPKGIFNAARDKYQKASSALKQMPKNVPVTTEYIKPVISDLKEFVRTGVSTPGKEVLKEVVQKVDNATRGSKTNLSNLWRTYKDINQVFKKHSSYSDLAQRLPQINQAIKETIKALPESKFVGNKELLKEFSQNALGGIDMWRGIHESTGIRNFLRKTVSPKTLNSSSAKFLLGYLGPVSFAKKVGAAKGVSKIWDTVETIFRSPEARKLYAQTLLAAQKKNAPAVLRSASQLDSLLMQEKDLPKGGQQWEIIDMD